MGPKKATFHLPRSSTTPLYVTLARLYAMGERLVASTFQSYTLWRFSHSLGTNTPNLRGESTCDLLGIACMEITERAREDPMRSLVCGYAASRIESLHKCNTFRQLLCDIPEPGKQWCLWMSQDRPEIPAMPSKLQRQFAPESKFDLQRVSEVVAGEK